MSISSAHMWPYTNGKNRQTESQELVWHVGHEVFQHLPEWAIAQVRGHGSTLWPPYQYGFLMVDFDNWMESRNTWETSLCAHLWGSSGSDSLGWEAPSARWTASMGCGPRRSEQKTFHHPSASWLQTHRTALSLRPCPPCPGELHLWTGGWNAPFLPEVAFARCYVTATGQVITCVQRLLLAFIHRPWSISPTT